MKHAINLIQLYYQVCRWYNRYVDQNVLRFSHNGYQGHISDEELLTIYLFCTMYEQKTTKKAMHTYIIRHWHTWFPGLPSYQTFNDRLNRLAPVFPVLLMQVLQEVPSKDQYEAAVLLGDSFPIMTCAATRQPKVALSLVSKDYCASKDHWYYGVRLHALAQQSLVHSLPHPVYLQMHTASKHDLEALRPILEKVENRLLVLDKAYCDGPLAQTCQQNQSYLFTPEKQKKGEGEWEKQQRHAYRKVLATAVATVRQPIESLFHWIDEKTSIQNASKIRATKGLLLHVFGKITAAFLTQLPHFNP